MRQLPAVSGLQATLLLGDLRQTVTLVRKPRRMFLCPGCNRRCEKLYLPPNGPGFACRSCYSLTYASAQRHDRIIDRLFRSGAVLGILGDAEATLAQGKLLHMLTRGWPRYRRKGIKPRLLRQVLENFAQRLI